jgi:hypothetical protein
MLSPCYSLGYAAGRVQLIDIRMEDSVHEADAGALVRILVWYFDVDLPVAAGEGRCAMSVLRLRSSLCIGAKRTLFWALEPYVELLPVLCVRLRFR